MKTAVIGTGFIAGLHKNALHSLGRSLDAVVGTSAEKAAAFAADTGAAVYSRVTDELLRDMDCLIVCTPPAEHGALLEKALNAGKHIFCEKPLCLTPTEADRLTALAESGTGMTAVDFNNRFYPSVVRMRARAENAALIRASYRQQYHIMPAPFSWRYTDPMRATTEIGSHMIDLITFVTRQSVTSVRAGFICAAPRRMLRADGMLYPDGDGTPVMVENEDAAEIDFTLSGGGCGHLSLSEIAEGHVNRIILEADTAEGTLCWDNDTPHILQCGAAAEPDGERGGFEDTFAAALAAFYAAAESGRRDDPRLCTFAQAARNVSVCQAIYDSAHRGGAEVAVR